MGDWETAVQKRPRYPPRLSTPPSPPGSSSRPDRCTRVAWLQTAISTARPTVGVSRPPRPPPAPQQEQLRSQAHAPTALRAYFFQCPLATHWRRTCIAVIGTRVLAGENFYGQLGDGNSGSGNAKAEPTAVVNGTVGRWIAIAAGEYHTCGLAADSSQYGKAYCWGETSYVTFARSGSSTANPRRCLRTPLAVRGSLSLVGFNFYGQLGDGDGGNNKAVPTAVDNSTVGRWVAISAGAGAFHTCGLAEDSSQHGKAYCWGESPWPCSRPRQ